MMTESVVVNPTIDSTGLVNNGFSPDDSEIPEIPTNITYHQSLYSVKQPVEGLINDGFTLSEVEIPKIPMGALPYTTPWFKPETAVRVRNAYKHYGSIKHPNKVLQNLNMTVSKGTIYGLLGASGCGKTTLLSCLVGRRHLNSGDIWVLGGKPGTKDSGIPGRRVGYMPQEIALYAEFSIRETMMYFGWIFGMPSKAIQERLDFLLKFLDLPSQHRLVKNLSGGQQRRVSFAVALLHDPELLILDEPTVGVDPLLRQSIWNHLVEISKDGNKTVIITTHYIEEARQAHCIGLMRNGRLLAEESPSVLLTTYNCQNLEDVFLMLSRNENLSTSQKLRLMDSSTAVAPLNKKNKKVEWVYGTQEKHVVGLNFHQSKEVLKVESNPYTVNNKTAYTKRGIEWEKCKLTVCGKMRALLHKNFLRLLRNVGVMLIIFAMPILQVVMFCLAVGRTPVNLPMAVVNKEMNWTTKECPVESPIDFFQEPLTHFSCHFLNMLRNDTIIKDYYENLEEAKEAAKMGKAWAVLYFPADFSENLYQRYNQGKNASSSVLDESTIRVWLDMSNQQIGLMFQRDLVGVFKDFAKWLVKNLNDFIMLYPFTSEVSHISDKLVDLPLMQLDPVYGDTDANFQDFVAPGVILTVIFFLSVSLTSSALIAERSEGTQDRTWVAGVSPGEILFSQVLTQFTVMCSQTVCVLVFMFLVFGVECKGEVFWISLITLLQGLNGMSFGFVISAICDMERNAIQMALGSFYPILMLSGVIWPVEGMGVAMRYTSYCLPLTLATSSLRNMLSRGWSINEPEVYWGFIGSSAWITFFLILSVILLKRRGI